MLNENEYLGIEGAELGVRIIVLRAAIGTLRWFLEEIRDNGLSTVEALEKVGDRINEMQKEEEAILDSKV